MCSSAKIYFKYKVNITYQPVFHMVVGECAIVSVASFPCHMGGGKSGLVCTVCTCTNYYVHGYMGYCLGRSPSWYSLFLVYNNHV